MILLLALLISTAPSLTSDCNEINWQVTVKSHLEISGTSNVNEFHCLSVNYEGQDIMKETCLKSGDRSSLSGEVIIKSVDFDCHNAIMTNDLVKTIKANEYPEIGIRFIGLQQDHSNTDLLSGDVKITLAGKSKTYRISCFIKDESAQCKHLEGSCTFRFSDFDLEPPSKLLGAIRVKDTMSVDFHLKLQIV